MNNLKYIGLSFISCAVLIVVLGLSTYLWKPVTAQLSYYNKTNICNRGYSNVVRVQQLNSGICNYVRVDYHYSLNQKFFSNSFIGFYTPINLQLDLPGSYKTITAYYLPIFPEVAVIKRGFGAMLASVLLFLGYFFLLIRKKSYNL